LSDCCTCFVVERQTQHDKLRDVVSLQKQNCNVNVLMCLTQRYRETQESSWAGSWTAAVTSGQLSAIVDVVSFCHARRLCYLYAFFVADCIGAAPCSNDVLLHDRWRFQS